MTLGKMDSKGTAGHMAGLRILFGWMLMQAVHEIRSAENGAITFYSLSRFAR